MITIGIREDMLLQAGKHLRSIRSKSSLSVHKVAKTMGISGNYLSELERGLKEPSDKVIEAISDYYEINSSALFAMYGRIAPIETDELLENPSLRQTIVKIASDDRLSEDEKAQLYAQLRKLYDSLVDKKENK